MNFLIEMVKLKKIGMNLYYNYRGKIIIMMRDKLQISCNISDNDSLYMLQLLYEEEGKKIPKLEYEIY